LSLWDLSVGIQGQLFQLMQRLESTTPHFIRCIKPNNLQSPGSYEQGLVLQQLRCCGVLEVVRISRSGFPTRMSHQKFAKRYNRARTQLLIYQPPSPNLSHLFIFSPCFWPFSYCLGNGESDMVFFSLKMLHLRIHLVFLLLFFISLTFCLKCIKLATQNCFSEQGRYEEIYTMFRTSFLFRLIQIADVVINGIVLISCTCSFQLESEWN